MEPEEIPDPQDLWWSAVALAALHTASGHPGCRFEADDLVVTLEQADGAWLRLQRSRGDRYVLWGRSTLAPPAPRDARRDAPDWALSPATEAGRPTFVAWFAHGEWDLTDDRDPGLPQLLRPWLSVDPRLASAAATGTLDGATIASHVAAGAGSLDAATSLVLDAGASPPPPARGSVRTRVRDQVHGQMREAREADRMLLQQPPEVVRWAQVHAPRGAFQHAVMLRRGEMVPSATNTALPRAARRSLANVLAELHRKESGEDHGAWLFARVTSDGTVARFDRAFDHWPQWWRVVHGAQGPSLDDLAWEMAQRAPRWRPGWAGLLPLRV